MLDALKPPEIKGLRGESEGLSTQTAIGAERLLSLNLQFLGTTDT